MAPWRCGSCRFAQPEVNGEDMVLSCRRFPPQLTIQSHDGETGEGASGWPPVGADDWCGEFIDMDDPSPTRSTRSTSKDAS